MVFRASLRLDRDNDALVVREKLCALDRNGSPFLSVYTSWRVRREGYAAGANIKSNRSVPCNN